MSTKKISALTPLGAAPAGNDLLVVVDVSDTTDGPAGTTKTVTPDELPYQSQNAGLDYLAGLSFTDEATFKSGVNLEPGVDVQAYNAGLNYLSGLSFTNEATFKAGVNLEIGTDVQAYNVNIATTAASQVEMEAGTETALRSMSPLRVAQAISSLASTSPSFVASGAITEDLAVVLNNDGTVSAVSLATEAVGTPVTFQANRTTKLDSAYDSVNERVVVVYIDGATTGACKAVVGTITGSSISFGTPVVIDSDSNDVCGIAYDSFAGKMVIAYNDAGISDHGYAVVGTVSGTTISLGTPVAFNTDLTRNDISVCYDSTNDKTVIFYSEFDGAQNNLQAIVGTVSGTSISFGTAVNIVSGDDSNHIDSIFDASIGKVIVAFSNAVTGSYGTGVVGTVSGTSISFGSLYVFQSSNSQEMTLDSDGAGKVLISYRHSFDGSKGKAVVGTITGTAIAYGTVATFQTGLTEDTATVYDPVNEQYFIEYTNSGQATGIIGTVTGTTVSFGTPFTLSSETATDLLTAVRDTVSGAIPAFYETTSTSDGVVFSPGGTNLTLQNYIGIAESTVADAQSVLVTPLFSTTSKLSGLNVNEQYYVNPETGALETTDNSGVKAGRSLSATTFIVGAELPS